MRLLFHYPLCGFSRIIRFILAEKRLDFELKYEAPWAQSEELFNMNIMGTLPVFVDISGASVFGTSAIREYLEEVYPEINLIGSDFAERMEARKLADCFDFIFYNDVYRPIIFEKITKRFTKNIDRTPDPAAIRATIPKLSLHLEYMTWLIDRRNWLAGKNFSIADIYAAAFISVLDYLGVISWNKYEAVKMWYAKIKSRPSFRNILLDNLPQIPPSEQYSNLDF
ncbi:glutathione S-transferase [Alphaproteobacteria bacterium]|nr:glutathione S-transferase [Alphaproteobacteria bacterium]